MIKFLVILLCLIQIPEPTPVETIIICDTADEIVQAVNDANLHGGNRIIEIMPGRYDLDSEYYKQLAIGPVPNQQNFKKYPLNFTTNYNILRAKIPGTVDLLGNSEARFNDLYTNQYRCHRGGIISIDRGTVGTRIEGINFDGQVPPHPDFNINRYCHRNTDDGVACWDFSHKAILNRGADVVIENCKLYNWCGETIWGDTNDGAKFVVKDCEFYNSQVSVLSGNWNLLVQGCEFHHIEGNCMEGLHAFTTRYYDNHFHDCSGAGINILGPVRDLSPPQGWWIEVKRNIFERFDSVNFGAVYLSKQTTIDVISPKNILIEENTFRDCRNALTASLGVVEKIHFLRNQVILDVYDSGIGISPKSASFESMLVKGNEFVSLGAEGRLYAGILNIGDHPNTRFVGNYYDNAYTPFDANGSPLLYFSNEIYKKINIHAAYQRKTNDPNIIDVSIPGNSNHDFSTGVYAVFNPQNKMNLRMRTNEMFVDGTELRLMGYQDNIPIDKFAFLADGSGCQLKDQKPVALASPEDYILLKYSSSLQLWIEVERNTPVANQKLRLVHIAKNKTEMPRFDEIPSIYDWQTMWAGWEVLLIDSGQTAFWDGRKWKLKREP